MYASISNQLYHLSHYAFSYFLLFFLVPKVLFVQDKGDKMRSFYANFSKMIALLTTLGYLLVILKLYEALALITLFSLYLVLHKIRYAHSSEPSAFIASAFDFFDNPVQFQFNTINQTIKRFTSQIIESISIGIKTLHKESLIVIMILFVAAYMRFSDALMNPAPSMSDGYVTLAWMKYVNERLLFHDGIYPQALYFYMSAIGKFAFINLLYVLKYTGPLNSLLIVLSLYFGVSRILNDRFAGILAALLYGVLGSSFLGGDWARQAATNSQEFGLVFITPAIYFLIQYYKFGRKNDFWAGLTATCDVGLTHPMAYVLMILGAGSVILSAVLQKQRVWKRIRNLTAIGVSSGIVTVLPVGVGLLLGKHFNSSGAQFATQEVTGKVPFPQLSFWDISSIAATLFILLAYGIFSLRKKPNITWISMGLFSLFSFLLYYAGGPLTHNLALISRTLDLFALVIPISLGVAVHVLITMWNENTLSAKLSIPASVALMAGGMVYLPPHPIIPYKMQWNVDVNEYLTINQLYQHKGYLIVSPNEEYALVLGGGFHMGASEFVASFNPAKNPLTLRGERRNDMNIPQDVFIYDHTIIFKVSKNNAIYKIEAPIYAKQQKTHVLLLKWIKAFSFYHPHNIQVFYKGTDLIVYHIHWYLPASTVQ